jgi:serine/threonine-protein kinase
VTPASDIYSLGVVAYECLSGRRPFTGDTPVSVALAQVREEPPALPPDTPGPARDLVMRMLAKDPAARPASAGELGRTALALRDAAEPEPWAPAGGGAEGGDAADREPWAPAGRGPDEGGGTDTNPGFALPPPRRSGRTLRAVAVLVVGVVALALLLRACTGSDPTAATSTQRGAAAAPVTTASGPPVGVAVDAERYVGRPAQEVARELRALGLLVDLDDVDGNGPVGSVAAVAPDGVLPPDSVVTVTVVRAAAERPRLDRGAEGRGGDNEGRGPGKKGRDKERDDEKDDD